MGRFLVRRLMSLMEAAVIAASAVAGSQLAVFLRAYVLEVAARLDETRRDLALLDAMVADSDQPDRSAYLGALAAGPEISAAQATYWQDKMARAADLQGALASYDAAPVWQKPLVLVQAWDGAIARHTWDHFTPALPLDTAGLLYTGLAVVLGLGLWAALCGICAAPVAVIRRQRRRRHRRLVSS